MNIIKPITLISIILLSSGCTVIKTLQATGGSKSDGIVELSFEYSQFEVPKVKWEAGLATATIRCNKWGYSEAEAFGGVVKRCQGYNGYGSCTYFFVTAKYQCSGSLSASK